MAEVLVTFTESVSGPDGMRYAASACGGEMTDGRWQGWLEFEAVDGSGTYRSPRETTQPNRVDLAYWATGLTTVYLEGALVRTLRPEPVPPPPVVLAEPVFEGPRPPAAADGTSRTEAVLNPFSVFRKGEAVLRRQLEALAAWHLVNIVQAYQLSAQTVESLNSLSEAELIELIVVGVRQETPAGS